MEKKILAITISAVLVAAVMIPASLQTAEAGHNTRQLPASSLQQVFAQLLELDRLNQIILGDIQEIQFELEDKATIICASDQEQDVENQDSLVITADSPFKLNALYVNFTTADGAELDYAGWTVIVEGQQLRLEILRNMDSGDHVVDLMRMDQNGLTPETSLADLTMTELDIDLNLTEFNGVDEDDTLIATACAWIAQIDKDSLQVEITT